jgi:hypothetical protein
VVVSNAGGGLPLLELLSRHTALELGNAGYRTTLLAGKEVNPEPMRRLLPSADVFIWEGHYRTLVDDFGFAGWTEPLPPSLLFLQSCLALNEREVEPLLARGAVAVVGSSTRIYSATGGAFTLAYFDALLYDERTLGGSLRQAKNFLLAYALLKEKRLGDEAPLTGANLRSARTFTLWGDPTLRLPRARVPWPEGAPRQAKGELPAVRHRMEGRDLLIQVPERAYSRQTVGRYQARLWPNGRLAGLIRPEGDSRRLVPLVFAEVPLAGARPGKPPVLRTRLPGSRWVFCWDDRRAVGYLLVLPREGERDIRFRVG